MLIVYLLAYLLAFAFGAPSGSSQLRPDNVKKTIIKAGNGTVVKSGDNITAHYTGWLYDSSKPDNKGKQFDSSRGGSPFTTLIGVGKVIKGWDQGITGQGGDPPMTVGERALLQMTPDLGYGSRGAAPDIPPNSTLLFDVEILSINIPKLSIRHF